MRKIKRIIVHCSATPNGRYYATGEIRKWHLTRGWKDIGYHAVVETNGKVEHGRREDLVGAHARGHNRDSLGVCLVGTDSFYLRQLEALRDWLEKKFDQYHLDVNDLHGHYEFSQKTCPGFDIDLLKGYVSSNNIMHMAPHILDLPQRINFGEDMADDQEFEPDWA